MGVAKLKKRAFSGLPGILGASLSFIPDCPYSEGRAGLLPCLALEGIVRRIKSKQS